MTRASSTFFHLYYTIKMSKKQDWRHCFRDAIIKITAVYGLFVVYSGFEITFGTVKKIRGGMCLYQEWMALLQENQLGKLIETNRVTERYGLTLTEEEAKLILRERTNALREQKRVEFGDSITPGIIYEFCDSDFIDQNNYVDTIVRLQEIFYLYKNEMLDEITDEELLHLMKEQFEQICFGDLDYLEGTCLNVFSQAVRAGYGGYKATAGHGEASVFDEVTRWDYNLYLEALRTLQ